jgi:hypothetical protein
LVEREDFLVCAHCGDRIGVYEPIVLVRDGRETALAHAPELWETRPEVIHAQCARMRQSEPG